MRIKQKYAALKLKVAEKVQYLRKQANDPNVPEVDRQKAQTKLARYLELLQKQQVLATQNGGSATQLKEA